MADGELGGGPARIALVDVETTGLSPERGDRVVEVAVAVYQGGARTTEFATLLNPERPIPYEVVRIHGITDEMVVQSPTFGEIAPRLAGLLTGTWFGAYNAQFDWGFLFNEFTRVGQAMPPMAGEFDVLELARLTMRGLPGYGLPAIARHLAINPLVGHRAMADVNTTAAVLLRLADQHPFGHDWEQLGKWLQAALPPNRIKPATMRLLKKSVTEHSPLRIWYQKRGAIDAEERVVVPRALVQLGRTVYLDAFCTLRNDGRRFLLTRIRKAEAAGEPAIQKN